MIRLLEKGSLPGFLKKDPLGCRVWSAMEAYGAYENALSFLKVWQQEESGAVFALLDGDLLLCSNAPIEEEAQEEVLEFIGFTGARHLLCTQPGKEFLPYKKELSGWIMKRENICRNGENTDSSSVALRHIHSLLEDCRSDTFLPPEFESFYLDLSHKLRHGAAKAICLYDEERPIAAAIAPAVTEEMALISSVAVSPAFRRKGLGSKALWELCRQLPSREVCIFRAEEENQEFYESLGFEEYEKFTQYILR